MTAISRIERGPRLSQGVVHGGRVYLAGQVALGATVAEQTRAVLGQIDALLAKAGSGKDRLLTVQVLLAEARDFDEMNSVYDPWIAEVEAPTRVTCEARLPDPRHKVEIVVTAACA
jgi:enamine deaminase RidA (YjgF/YER057c/UK114 family)